MPSAWRRPRRRCLLAAALLAGERSAAVGVGMGMGVGVGVGMGVGVGVNVGMGVGVGVGAFRPPAATAATAARIRAQSLAPGGSCGGTVLRADYGRGSEIWPPTNEGPVLLSDSFPGGTVPSFVADALAEVGAESGSPAPPPAAPAPALRGQGQGQSGATSGRKRRILRAAVGRVLRRAATSERRSAAGDTSARGGDDAFWDAPVDRIPALMALLLAGSGLVRPTDVMAVAAWTAYLVGLALASGSPRETEVPSAASSAGALAELPALPPQGHVPSLVSNPLGTVLTNSPAYRTWLRIGAVLGLLLPLGALACYTGLLGTARGNPAAATAAARPVFLLCCQAATEATSRRLLAPLPLRILVPAAYSALRLGPLWDWALAPVALGRAGRALAVANYVYWAANLFGFLLPVASVRYMRAHFFCVEAEEVQLREGQVVSAGLLP